MKVSISVSDLASIIGTCKGLYIGKELYASVKHENKKDKFLELFWEAINISTLGKALEKDRLDKDRYILEDSNTRGIQKMKIAFETSKSLLNTDTKVEFIAALNL